MLVLKIANVLKIAKGISSRSAVDIEQYENKPIHSENDRVTGDIDSTYIQNERPASFSSWSRFERRR